MGFSMKNVFSPSDKYEDVRNINIYLLRGLFLLTCFVLGRQVWTFIFSHSGVWESEQAVAYSVFAGFTLLAFLGMINPIKMLPLLFLEIIYKVLWLYLVAYPVWFSNQAVSATVESRIFAFSLVLIPIVIMPWKYAYKTYIRDITQA